MRLQRGLSVDDVDAGLLDGLGPMDVHALVEARLELDQRDRLLAALGCVDQGRDERRVVARAIHGLLDRKHVRVGDGLLDEALHGGREGVIGVVHKQVPSRIAPSTSGRSPSWRSSRGWMIGVIGGSRSSGSRAAARSAKRAHVQQAFDRIDLLLGHPEQLGELAAQRRRAARAELDAHDLAETPAAQLVLDGLQQVGGVVGDLEVGVARDTEDVVVDDLHPWEECVEMVAITSSSGTRVVALLRGWPAGLGPMTKRGRISVGTFTRAKTVWSVTGSRTRTARLSERLEMYGKGRPGATASGVRAGKTTFWKWRASWARCSLSSPRS